MGPPMPEYSPDTSILVTPSVFTVTFVTLAAPGLNWLFQRSILA
jgi:hypothetical protein